MRLAKATLPPVPYNFTHALAGENADAARKGCPAGAKAPDKIPGAASAAPTKTAPARDAEELEAGLSIPDALDLGAG